MAPSAGSCLRSPRITGLMQTPFGSRPSMLQFGRQPALRTKLLQARGQGQRRRGSERGRDLRPRGGEHLVLGALRESQAPHEPALAVEPVRDVLVELRRWVPYLG